MAVLADGQVGVATQLLAVQHQASGLAQVPANDVDHGIGHAQSLCTMSSCYSTGAGNTEDSSVQRTMSG